LTVRFAGICHTDIHFARGEKGTTAWPVVVGHEIGGIVVAKGKNVTRFSEGDHAGVGCMVDSCRSCRYCRRGDEQYCATGPVYTYNSTYRYGVEPGGATYGGYSRHIVVDRDFAFLIPKNLDLAAATPLMCAGITMFSPIQHFGLSAHMKFGVIGLGGLGHMGVKFGLAFGCHTSVISRGTKKRDAALNDLKAHAFIDSSNADEMKAAAGSFDFLICTISADYDINMYTNLLSVDGQLVIVGASPNKLPLSTHTSIVKRVNVTGSHIGGVRPTQDMLDFCGLHNITCDIEMVTADRVDEAWERTVNSDVKYRFVIDASTIN
jgi:uncharacterized zinc-type alcohol dehydrogenase-like protein